MSERRRTRGDRGQLSLSVVEAGVGILVVVAVLATFGLSLPDPGAREAQLDTYAADATTVLERRVERVLPANLLFRLATPHGAVGYPVPDRVVVGRASVPTVQGDVTLRVWYA